MTRFLLAAALGLVSSSVLASDGKVEAAIKTLVPNAQIDSIAESRVPGLYEVVMPGHVVYVSADGKYLIQGSLYDVENKLDLTENTRAGIRRKELAKVGKSQRIVYPAKNEKYAVTVFTDIDCGYCRRLHQEMAQYNDMGITVEYLFFPRAGVGSEAFDKAVSVWCSDDRQKALTDAKAGISLDKKQCDNPIANDYQLGQKLGVTGTPAVYAPDGTQLGGYLAPAQLLQRLQALAAQ
ncbi:MAG: DsbC family protein [Lysobacteraceae bacterium]